MSQSNLTVLWTLVVFRGLSTVFSTWVCFEVYRCVSPRSKEPSHDARPSGIAPSVSLTPLEQRHPIVTHCVRCVSYFSSSENVKSLSPSSIGSQSSRKNRFGLYSSMLCTVMFTLTQYIGLIHTAAVIHTSMKSSDPSWKQISKRPLVSVTSVIVDIPAIIGFNLLLLVSFERMRNVFVSTPQFRVADQTVRLVHCLLLSIWLCEVTLSVVIIFVRNPQLRLTLTLCILLPPMLLYFSLTVWTQCRFWANTMQIVRNMQQSEFDEHADRLAHSSLRVALSTFSPLVTTLLSGTMWIAGQVDRSVMVVSDFLLVINFSFNCFCVLCTFSSSHNSYYEPCFGWLHSRLLRRLQQE